MSLSKPKFWPHKDLLDIDTLSLPELELIMEMAEHFIKHNQQANKKLDFLKGRTVTLFFSEASTRTKTSFDTAGKRLGADTFSLSTSGSSIQKGESLKDTAQTLQSLSPDLIVIRNSSSGAAQFLSQILDCSIVNAGDGQNAHPTQALLDLYSLLNIWAHDSLSLSALQNKKILILGDINHSRVARSNIRLLQRLGVQLRVCAPKTLLPKAIDTWNVEVFSDLQKALCDVDAVIALRLQLERQQAGLLPSLSEYSNRYCLTKKILTSCAKPEIKILHPGPIIRGLDLSADVADSESSLVLQQVAAGLAVRMAVLTLYINKENPYA